MAHIDPHTPEGAAYLADHLASGVSVAEAIHAALTVCEICGRHFTDHKRDGESLDVWASAECISDERYDPIRRAWA